MYWSILLCFVLAQITPLQTRRPPPSICQSIYEPCERDCLLAVHRIDVSKVLLFYTRHLLELDLNQLAIDRFEMHTETVAKAIANETCSLFVDQEIVLSCLNQTRFYRYIHSNQTFQQVSCDQLTGFHEFSKRHFVFQTNNRLILFEPEGYAVCETSAKNDSKNCQQYKGDFLTALHLQETKGVFMLPNGVVYFGSDYLLLLQSDKNVSELVEPEPDEPKSTTKADESGAVTEDQDKNAEQHEVNLNERNLDIVSSDKLVQILLDQISRNRKSVRKLFYKHLFGCTAIQTRPDYRVPLHKNLPAYHAKQRSFITHDLFRSSITCYYWLFLFLISFLLITRLLNSGLASELEHLLYKENISDRDRLFLQLRTEIENGVLRKLEPTDISRELSSRPSEMRILIDTLLHEQLVVNALNLDARRSIDLVRHLINEVCETIKLRRSDKSAERVTKKFKHLTN